MAGMATHKDTDLSIMNSSIDHILEMSRQNIVKVRSAKVAWLFQASQGRVWRSFGSIAIEQVTEDVRGDVLPLGGDVSVDVQLEVSVMRQRASPVDRAVEQIGEPEQIVLLTNSPVEIDTALRVGVLAGCIDFTIDLLVCESRTTRT